MEYLSHAVNWLHACAGLIILGTMAVCLLSGEGGGQSTENWRRQCPKVALFLSVILILAGLALPSLQAAFLEENISAAFDTKVLEIVLFSTRFGMVWMIQESVAVLIFLALLLHKPLIQAIGRQRFFILMVSITALMLLTGSFKSHAASLEPMWPGLLGNSLHVIAAGMWLGGLPALLFLLRSSRNQSEEPEAAVIGRTLKRFSIMATIMVGVILLSGIVIGYLQIDRWGELFATPYGLFLITKIVLFLMMLSVAAVIRFRYMPQFGSKASTAINFAIAKWVTFETSAGILLLAVASVLKETTPASHEEEMFWPFVTRFSIEATWDESSDIRMQVSIGIALVIAAMALTIFLIRKGGSIKQAIIAGAVLTMIGLGVGLPPLGVESYPDTYKNSTVPYIAVSISNGEDLFRDNCIACHGEGGLGDGPLAEKLSEPPANLSEPHTALHTVGDMYWWLTHGLGKGKPMPSFSGTLDEDELWDLINYLRAFSEGFTGRLLQPHIAPELPFLGAPDFYYSTASKSGNLKDLRGKKAVLLSFFSWPESKARLDALKAEHDKFTANDAVIIAIAMRGGDEMSEAVIAEYPFLIITEETRPITRTYAQFRRTFKYGGDPDDKDLPMHIGFTVDRFGYLRSRWIPEQNPGIWDDISFLAGQFAELAKEDEILPPPDEHVH